MSIELLNHHLISERYFFPRPGGLQNPFLIDCGDAQLACAYHETNKGAKTLVHFHGNGEIVDDWQGDFVSRIHAMGCNCLLAEFRGYGRSTGTPELGKMLNDVVRTVEALDREPTKLIFFGRSVGSIFAIEAASKYPAAAGLILESGIADVLERLLLRVAPQEMGVEDADFQAAVAQHLDHQEKLGKYSGPTLVLHTENDGLVDVSHGRRLHAWAGNDSRLKVFPRGSHNDIMYVNAQEYFESLDAFVARLRE